jgi:putative NADH-flavin reductase
MTAPTADGRSRRRLHHVAVVGAAGGLGQGILGACRAAGVGFTAIVRARPERITDVPVGSRVVVVPSLADRRALTEALSGSEAVLTALGITATSDERSALLSANMAAVEASMSAAGVDRIVMVNTLLSAPPGQRASRAMRFFRWMPGTMGRGAREQQAVIDALGAGAFSTLRWTLVRAGVNARGKDEPPVASASWEGALNSWSPVSYGAMGRWMLEEAAADEFVHAAPLVSRRRTGAPSAGAPRPRPASGGRGAESVEGTTRGANPGER